MLKLKDRQSQEPRTRAALNLALGLAVAGALLSGAAAAPFLSGIAHGAQASRSAVTAAKVFAEARQSFDAERWAEASEKFDRFVASYPKDRNTAAALYWLAQSLKHQGKLAEADARLERLAVEFARSEWAEEARALRVEIAGLAGNTQLVGQAARDESDDVKLAALQSLLRLDLERGLALASEILKGNSGAGLKEASVMLLGEYGDARALPLLNEVALSSSASVEVRVASVQALGQIADAGSLDLLKELATRADGGEVSEAALYSAALLPGERATSFIRELAQSESAPSEARASAVLLLAQRESEQSAEELFRLYDSARDMEVKKQTLLALGQLKGARSRAKLLEVARQPGDAELRGQAVLGLGQRGDAESLEQLSLLYDEVADEDVREWIIVALGQSGAKAGSKKLLEVARGATSERLRQAALLSLERSSDPEVKKFLKSLTK
jgi:HEAT repeat protein